LRQGLQKYIEVEKKLWIKNLDDMSKNLITVAETNAHCSGEDSKAVLEPLTLQNGFKDMKVWAKYQGLLTTMQPSSFLTALIPGSWIDQYEK